MAAGVGEPLGSGHGQIRAADADRDRVAGILGTAYSEGRLSKDEYDARLEASMAARTYGDLDQVLSDLPVRAPMPVPAQPATVPSVARTNGYAIASFACGLGQFVAGPLATIPAIVFGHMARNQIRRTGEQGAGLALAGLVLGWGAVILAVILIAVGLAVAAGTSNAMQMP
ncbi:MAG TPA: DUF1707 and DUF4190 domain-containing protein [Trebonia sp.]|jgi:hypothetical protein